MRRAKPIGRKKVENRISYLELLNLSSSYQQPPSRAEVTTLMLRVLETLSALRLAQVIRANPAGPDELAALDRRIDGLIDAFAEELRDFIVEGDDDEN